MTTDVGVQAHDVEEISLERGRRMLDEAARQYLNMSADEFILAWDEGRFTDPDSLRVQQVAALLPFAR
jgi:hypothetical protein